MRWIRALVLAFSTYTRIPMPQVKWDDQAMRLAIAFLPLAGAVIGAAIWIWRQICQRLEMGAALFAAVAVALPILITGGIHADGYCDTSDALASWQGKSRRLEILKDPNIGAFALIRFSVYLLLSFALMCELYTRGMVTAGFAFLYALSRCFAAWSAVALPNARKDGMLAAFTAEADRFAVRTVLALLTFVSAAGWVYFDRPGGLTGVMLCIAVTFWYQRMVLKNFGGATGDTTGFYLQTVELALPAGLLIYRVLLLTIGEI